MAINHYDSAGKKNKDHTYLSWVNAMLYYEKFMDSIIATYCEEISWKRSQW
jgi:hypothetical protein